jgi:anti-sigma factor RsiW
MTACTKASDPAWPSMLQGFVDGELDSIHAVQLETHLAHCPVCAGELDRLKTVRQRIAQKGVSWRAPDHVRSQVLDLLTREARLRHVATSRPARGGAQSFSVAGWIRQWLFVPSFAALAASLFLVLGPLQTRSSLEQEIVASHIRSTLASHLTDVQTSDQHTVKPWFNGKIDFAPPVTDLAGQGFPLVGGRVDYIGGRVVAALIYRRHAHVINLFIWPAPAPAAGSTMRDGYAIESWTSKGLNFSAVSDTDAEDIHRFREAFVAQTENQKSTE